MTISEELKWRGFINQTTLTDLTVLDNKKFTFYNGYDASSDSLAIGNLASLMLDKLFIRHGYKAVLLAGGATSLIGDPGGKESERDVKSVEEIEANVAKVQKQIENLFSKDIVLVNNLEWFKDMRVLDFLREVGKNFSMTPLVQRDYIAKRLGPDSSGISYAEFSYTLLQGYDYLALNRKYGVDLQLAGSDQWGNSLSGVDLIRRLEGKEVHVLTMPLVINKATGKKFGKSEEGAVWLDPKLTSPYQFYQFWLNVDDTGVESYLKIYTELDKPQIESIMTAFQVNRAGRIAQKTLAYEVTKLVHGQQRTDAVKKLTDVLFSKEGFKNLPDSERSALYAELPYLKANSSSSLISILVDSGLAESNSEANRFVADHSVSVDGQRFEGDSNKPLSSGEHLIQRGKNDFSIVEIQ